MHPPLILASTSPFRQQLLQRLGIAFETFHPAVDEQPLTDETAACLVERLAVSKARAAAASHSSGLVIGSDQVCVIGEQILGKPASHEHAVAQLRSASGQCVEFLTGLCLYNLESRRQQSCVEPYRVHFRQLGDTQIEYYLNTEQPYDCAGSFKSEGLGICLFEKLDGDDPNALIGLPLIRLVQMLQNEGMDVLLPDSTQ